MKPPFAKMLISLLILTSFALAADKIKSLYKVTRLSPNVLAVSCPTTLDAPKVIEDKAGVLLISCDGTPVVQ